MTLCTRPMMRLQIPYVLNEGFYDVGVPNRIRGGELVLVEKSGGRTAVGVGGGVIGSWDCGGWEVIGYAVGGESGVSGRVKGRHESSL
jgi:hypothetical protein